MSYSYSGLSAYRSCGMLYYYSRVLKKQGFRRTPELDFGKAFHGFLEAHHGRMPWPEHGFDGLEALQFEALCNGYVNEYPHESFSVVSVEQKFSLELFPNELPGRMFNGVLDMIVQSTTGQLWLYEHKTSNSSPDASLVRWAAKAFDLQTQMYVRACELLGTPVHGVVFNVCKRPQLRFKRGETLPELQGRLFDAVQGVEYFNRFHVPFIDYQDLPSKVLPIVNGIEGKLFTRNNEACYNYNRECDFFEACTKQRNIQEYPDRAHR